jgi:hypothetical protein
LEQLLPFLFFIFFSYLTYRWTFFSHNGISKHLLFIVFSLKVGAGLALWAIYTFYYTDRSASDIYKYFDDALVIYEAFKINPAHYVEIILGFNADGEHLSSYYQQMNHWDKEYDYGLYNDNRTIIRFNALILLLSKGNIHVHTIFMCFLSLLGLMGIYRTFAYAFPEKKAFIAVAIFFLPSVMFWGSGILKEGLLVFGLGIFVLSLFRLWKSGFSMLQFLIALLSFSLLLFTKFYVVISLVPAVISLIILRFTGNKSPLLVFALTHAVLVLIALNLYRLGGNYDVMAYISQKQHDFINVAAESNAGSIISIKEFSPEWQSLVLNLPQALFNVLMRPHFLDIKSFIMLPAAFENLLLLALFFLCISYFKKPSKENTTYLFLALFFTFLLSGIIGYITPILGAIVRYKVPLLPFLAIIFIILTDTEKVKTKFIKKFLPPKNQ